MLGEKVTCATVPYASTYNPLSVPLLNAEERCSLTTDFEEQLGLKNK